MDDDDLFTKIRQTLEREDLEQALSGEKESIPSEHQQPSLDDPPIPLYRPVINLSSDYAAGLALIAWTLLPGFLGLIFGALPFIVSLCIYSLFCPFVWVGIVLWKPDEITSTFLLGIVGQVFLAISMWFILKNSGDFGGNSIGFDFVGLLILLALLAFSFLGSMFTITFTGVFLVPKDR